MIETPGLVLLRWAVLTVLALALIDRPRPALAQAPLYAERANAQELRFGATIGSGVRWMPHTPQTSASVSFGGRAALTCSGLDYSGFLRTFDAKAFLNDMKNQLVAGAQGAVATYLITLAYSNPTLASVLDMMNQSYNEKFAMFQSACNAQEARQRGMERGARRMAEAQDQCYEEQVNRGVSPSEAYQSCANQSTFGSVAAALPAGKETLEFLRSYTTLNVTREIEALLGLLPDERVSASGHEVRPPRISLHAFNANIEARTANALGQVLAGASPVALRDCTIDDYLNAPISPADACVAPTAANLLQTQAFLAARQLSAEARRLYVDALASQIAITAIRGAVLDLMSQVKKMDVKAGAGAQATEVVNRKAQLEEQIALLRTEADALQKHQEAKAGAARTQILALEMVSRQINRVEQSATPKKSGSFSFDAFKSLFASE